MRFRVKLLFVPLAWVSYLFAGWVGEACAQEKLIVIAQDDPLTSFLDWPYPQRLYFKPSKTDKRVYQGTDFDVMKRILDNLGIDYEFQLVPWQKIESFLREGKAHIALGLQKTPAGLQIAHFLKSPLRTKNYFFYANKPKSDKNTTILSYREALAHNDEVGIIKGILYPDSFWKNYPFQKKNLALNTHLKEFSSQKDCLKALQQNTIQLCVGESVLTNTLLHNMKLEETIVPYRNILFWKDFYAVFSKSAQFSDKENLMRRIEGELLRLQEQGLVKSRLEFWADQIIVDK